MEQSDEHSGIEKLRGHSKVKSRRTHTWFITGTGRNHRYICLDELLWVGYSLSAYYGLAYCILITCGSERYDFMGQMAFGTDFGMLKTGSDNQGVWRLMEKGTL